MWRVLSIFLAMGLLLGCGEKKMDRTKAPAPSVSKADQALLRKASDKLIDRFSGKLKSELMAAMAEGGAANAISVCSVKAPQLASDASGEFWNIRRVSDRFRNPGNSADSHQIAILARFKDTTSALPAEFSEWSGPDSSRLFTYYKPIYVAPLCLNCHGIGSQISPEAAAAIEQKYPNDHAVGYRTGDLRGLFVVTVKWPEGKEFAEQMLAPTPQ